MSLPSTSTTSNGSGCDSRRGTRAARPGPDQVDRSTAAALPSGCRSSTPRPTTASSSSWSTSRRCPRGRRRISCWYRAAERASRMARTAISSFARNATANERCAIPGWGTPSSGPVSCWRSPAGTRRWCLTRVTASPTTSHAPTSRTCASRRFTRRRRGTSRSTCASRLRLTARTRRWRWWRARATTTSPRRWRSSRRTPDVDFFFSAGGARVGRAVEGLD
mmetsp:Transcript_6315/g.25656  ORF Transcript_6315/g.25656 Transcript_6315/m.25656 type:complete len:221 (+) Transcript_6315:1325-1987(+)